MYDLYGFYLIFFYFETHYNFFTPGPLLAFNNLNFLIS
jgi:hypothetical protein